MPFQSAFALECCFRCVYPVWYVGIDFAYRSENYERREREEHQRWNANTFSGCTMYIYTSTNTLPSHKRHMCVCVCMSSTLIQKVMRVQGKGEYQRECEQNM